jgi:hypothetical protein
MRGFRNVPASLVVLRDPFVMATGSVPRAGDEGSDLGTGSGDEVMGCDRQAWEDGKCTFCAERCENRSRCRHRLPRSHRLRCALRDTSRRADNTSLVG